MSQQFKLIVHLFTSRARSLIQVQELKTIDCLILPGLATLPPLETIPAACHRAPILPSLS
uniref:Uncharacterized protein n=1 Tax=Arundo donax TaxID=35708 RepID=A0A0A8Y2I7_ARUDO